MWIPAQRCLIDPTILQFLPEDSLSWEAVIASHGRFRITYTLAPTEATAPVLGHSRMLKERDDLLRRSMNVASAALALMATHLPAERVRQIPHSRAAALLTATRDLPAEQTPAGDWRFTAPGMGSKPTRLTLAEIPILAGTPPTAPMP